MALLKLIYLATKNIEKKWTSPLQNWSLTVSGWRLDLETACPRTSNGIPKGASPFRGLKTKRQSLNYTPLI